MRVWIVVFILATATVVIGEFTETPMMPVNVTLNEDVVFRCRHTNALTYAWYINGSAIGNNPPADITPSFNTLTIIALPHNNNTVVQCVAIIHNGTLLEEGSPPVILIIPGVSPVSTSVSTYYEVQNISTGVCITCTFLDNSTTDCVVVVHQRISQLSSSGLMNIESSHKFTRSGGTACGCIEGVNLEQYQVGVIGGKRLIPSSPDRLSSTCSTGCIIGSVIGVIVFVATVVTLIIVIVILSWRRMRNKKVKGASLNVRPHEGGNGNDIPLPARTPNSDVAGTQAAVGTTENPVTLPPTNEPSAETIDNTRDDLMQQVLHLHTNQVPILGANNGPPVALPSVNNGPEETQSSTFTGATPVIQPNEADQANSRNAESSLPNPPIDKEDAIRNHIGGLNQESSSGNGSKIANYPISTGMPSSSVQPEYVVRSSNAAIAGSNEEQEQMLAAGKSEDSHPKPFQSKHSIKAIRDLPSSTVSREHLGGASDSSLQTVRPSLNSFVKIEWHESKQECNITSENEGD